MTTTMRFMNNKGHIKVTINPTSNTEIEAMNNEGDIEICHEQNTKDMPLV